MATHPKRVALVTGGSRGIGLGIAEALADSGFDLAVNGVREAAAVDEAIQSLIRRGSEVLYCRGNVAEADDRQAIVDAVRARFGRLDVLVNNAGRFAGGLFEEGDVDEYYDLVQVNFAGLVHLTQRLLRPMLQDVNVVSAPTVAKERGIVIEEVTREAEGDYDSLITVTVTTERQSRHISGTVFAAGRPRIVNIKGIRMDAEFGPSMIYITNLDKPGFIGRFSSTLGEAGINIATFHVGREAPGGNAVALIEIDGELPAEVLAKVRALPQVQSARPLKF